MRVTRFGHQGYRIAVIIDDGEGRVAQAVGQVPRGLCNEWLQIGVIYKITLPQVQ